MIFGNIKKKLLQENKEREVVKAASLSSSVDGMPYTHTELFLEPKAKTSLMSDEEAQFLNLCQKVLRKLGFIKNTYEFSEQFMNKSKHYYSMLLSEGRQCSIDALYNLIKNISVLNDGLTYSKYLDDLHEQGNKILTKRLLKYIP